MSGFWYPREQQDQIIAEMNRTERNWRIAGYVLLIVPAYFAGPWIVHHIANNWQGFCIIAAYVVLQTMRNW